MKGVVCASLVLFASVSLLSADYYVVESNGDAYPVQKAAKGYERISDRPSFTSSFSLQLVDTVYYFDPDVGGWYYPNRDSNTIVLFLFNSEYACSLIAVGINYYSPEYAELYVWEGPDPLPGTTAELETELNATWDYDTLTNNWDSWPRVLYGPQPIGSTEPPEPTERTCWVDLVPNLDIGTSAVYVGYRIVTHYNPAGTPYGGKPWTLSDNWVDPGANPPRFAPCRSWMYREQPGAATDNQWIEYGDQTGDWEFFFVIDMIIHHDIPVTRLPGTYDTGERVLSTRIVDFGPPPESAGISEAWLLYYINDDPGTLDSTEMFLTDGTIQDGIWEAVLPGQVAETKVTYYVRAIEVQGSMKLSEKWSYYVRAGTLGNMLLLLEEDAYYGGSYSHDAVNAVAGKVDVWDENVYGTPDSTVFQFYMPSGKGPGQGIIFWYAWQGYLFARQTDFLGNFLDAGGKLFVSSQDLPAAGFHLTPDYTDWVAPAGHFVHDYLKVYEGYDDYYGGAPHPDDTTFTQYGVPGDTITGSVNLEEILVYPYGWGAPGWNYAGKFDSLDADAVQVLRNSSSEVMGYRYEDPGGYKVVFIYWPCNYIATLDLSGWDTEAQDTLIARTLQWFGYQTEVQEKTSDSDVMFLRTAPNPLKKKAIIQYGLLQRSRVDMVIYNLLGERVKTLADHHQPPGLYTATWDATDDAGRKVPSGTYFLRLAIRPVGEGSEQTATKKICVVR